MPELPEVETTKRGISPHITGKKLKRLEIRDHRLRWPVDKTLGDSLANRKILGVSRRAKYLLLEFDRGFLSIHLGMSGSLRICKQSEEVLKHDHAIFHFPNKLTMRFNDPRRFGSIVWMGEQVDSHKLISELGPEPFSDEFTAERLFTLSRKRTVAAKNFIMNNATVVGVGNIYANEALFLSGIRPNKAAKRLTKTNCEALHKNIIQVLSRAIEQGGSTLRDFVNANGQPGYFQQTLNVYGREGETCHVCGTTIKHQVIGQRASFYCPKCQS